MPVAAVIDYPTPNSLNDPLCVRVEGWVYGGERHLEIDAVEIFIRDRCLAATKLLFARPDVSQALQLAAGVATGFTTWVHAGELVGSEYAELSLRVRFRDGTSVDGPQREIRLIAHDYRTNHYGTLLRATETTPSRRNDIYNSGPPSQSAHPECQALIQRYVAASAGPILDVGCGVGAMGRALRKSGYDWFGVEVSAACCAEMARLDLPHQQVAGGSLPFAGGAFANAICIEVLEHILEPDTFVREIRRVTRERLLISVPNLEVIPYLQNLRVVPWHILDGDHFNFFGRHSLQTLLRRHFRNVEVLEYLPMALTSPEGLPLYYHLFAICEV